MPIFDYSTTSQPPPTTPTDPNHPTPEPPPPPRRHNVSLLAYSPLAGGALSGKYLTPDAPKTARFNLFPGAFELRV